MMKQKLYLIGLMAAVAVLAADPGLAQGYTPGSGTGTLGSDNSMTSQGLGTTPGSGAAVNAPLGTTEMNGLGYGGSSSGGDSFGSGSDTYGSSYGSSGSSQLWNQVYMPNISNTVPDLDLASRESDTRTGARSGESSGGNIFLSPFADSDDADSPARSDWPYLILFAVLAVAFVGILVWMLKARARAYY